MERKRFAKVFLSLVLLASFLSAGGVLDPKLSNKMNSESGPFQVIVTFNDRARISDLSGLGVNYLTLSVLPMAGAVLTSGQIRTVLSWESVRSVYLNDRLQYFNHDAGEITGAHEVQRVLGITGKGTTVVVIDGGIDATHPDLTYGGKVVQNVKVVGDLGLLGTTAYVEGVENTDNTSGHGTHVAGTVGGTGTASANDERDHYYYRGVAPGCKIVGIGAGEALFILSALEAFDYAIGNQSRYGINVITNSWGNSTSQFDPSDPINVASYEAYRRGIVVTFAAGNGGPGSNTMSSYAISPWVIGVAAGTKTKELADFSSRGESGAPYEHPDITAPGIDITSTRALATPIGATGPVVDPNHPSYYATYCILSGTSMATPFVAGTVALLLEANPRLSPDQVESILTATADPMSGHSIDEVGAGYINVRRAVDMAESVTGSRTQFLTGDVRWASTGEWASAEESDTALSYLGKWRIVSGSSASGGGFAVGRVMKQEKKADQRPGFLATFYGTSVKVGYLTAPDGGTAEVLIDGEDRGTIGFYSTDTVWGKVFAVAGLGNQGHTMEFRALGGTVYFDNLLVDGRLYPSSTIFQDETQTFTGTLGPSVDGTPETRLLPFEVGASTIQLRAELSWSGGIDVDLYLIDPSGSQVAESASLNNPETLDYWVDSPGTYTYKIVGYVSAVVDYTLTSTQTEAVSVTSPARASRPVTEVSLRGDNPERVEFGNYPNPFNPATVISYSLPFEAVVTLRVFNLLGKEIVTLVNHRRESAGEHRVRFNGSAFPSGVYFSKIEIESEDGGSVARVRRIILLK